jgi:DNA-binding NarL/FixJ family response regulator
MLSHRGSRRQTTLTNPDSARPHVAVVAARQLCGACLQSLLRPFFDDHNVPVYGSEAQFFTAVDAGAKPDAIIFSSICPEAFDLELLQRLIDALPDVPVAVHVDVQDSAIVNRLIGMGVKGILPTTTSPRVAVAALQLVAAGGTYVPPAAELAPTRPAHRSAGANAGRSPAKLTDRQLAVLALAADGKTNKEIARFLGLTQNTVKVHLARLMRRLGVTNRVGLARLAPGVLGQKIDPRVSP